MARFLQYKFILPTATAIVSTTNITIPDGGVVNAILPISGSLSNGSGGANIIGTGSVRSATITAGGNASAIEFTITGLQNGGSVTIGPIAGPDSTTSDTKVYFDVITSITYSAANATGNPVVYNNISIGIGKSGFLPLVLINLLESTSDLDYTFSIFGVAPDALDYTVDVYGALSNVYNNGSSYENLISSYAVIQTPTLSPIDDTDMIVPVFASEALQYLLFKFTIEGIENPQLFNFQFLQV